MSEVELRHTRCILFGLNKSKALDWWIKRETFASKNEMIDLDHLFWMISKMYVCRTNASRPSGRSLDFRLQQDVQLLHNWILPFRKKPRIPASARCTFVAHTNLPFSEKPQNAASARCTFVIQTILPKVKILRSRISNNVYKTGEMQRAYRP